MTEADRLRITELMEIAFRSSAEANALERAQGDRATLRHLRAENNRANGEHREIRARLYREFATSRGWITTEKRFTLAPLVTGRPRGGRVSPYDRTARQVESDTQRLIDHPECFRLPMRPYAPIAMLSHTYEHVSREQHLDAARRHGLAVEFLEWSWYYPDRCLAALYIRQ